MGNLIDRKGPHGDPTITISFSKDGCFARKHYPSGHTFDMDVNEAMREFDKFSEQFA